MSLEKLLWEKDAVALAAMVRRGDIAAPELVEAAIARLEAVNGEINAVAEKLYDHARRRAADIDRTLPLAGVPFAIKDLGVVMKGVPVHGGSRVAPFTADYSSTLVERQLAAGLIPIATSTSPEYGLRLVTESAAFGATRNPWNRGHVTGGSSGGAAALVSAGVLPVAHASDGGGSIRVPAACTGLVGLKPSRGRVPLTPYTTEPWFGFVVDHALARSVRDSAVLLDLTHGADALSPYIARPPKGTFAGAAAREPGRLTLAVYRGSPLGLEISQETHAALEKAVELAREGGHSVEEIDLPMVGRDFITDFARLVAGAVAGHLRLESERVGRNVAPTVERGTRVLARYGELLPAAAFTATLERLHARARELLAATMRFDAVLMPILAHPPVEVGGMDAKGAQETVENLLDRLRLTRLLNNPRVLSQLIDNAFWFTHWPAIQNVTGQPSIALPVHVTAAGLPLGIQAAGRLGDEETLISFAAQMESLSGWRQRRAPLRVPA